MKNVAKILEAIQTLIKEFEELFLEELPTGLPPTRNIRFYKAVEQRTNQGEYKSMYSTSIINTK